ncbi:MAG: transcriptional repressor NrdR [Eubacteriaceae bacterium]|nr:transcriptional repressor NrdR [Eubacteriaceae bacterium]MBR5996291.1 transcriptional repressor NrdR [Eubacteriaceae bacterium]
MKCPKCGCVESRVLDSRPFDNYNAIRRRRECTECKFRFTTYERAVSVSMMVVKRDSTREEYDRTKIIKGIMKACEKRPVSIDQIEEIVSEIENELFETSAGEVLSTDIGEAVMRHLKDVDDVAYVRFASVYRQFKDVNTFMDELQKILAERK